VKHYTIIVTEEERRHLLYGLQSASVGPDDKDTMYPEDYKARRRMEQRLRRKLENAKS